MGHTMTEVEAVNIATAFAQRELGWLPEVAGARKDPLQAQEWIVQFTSTPPGAPLMDPATVMVIVDVNTHQARWFLTL